MTDFKGIPVWKEYGYRPRRHPPAGAEAEKLETLIVGGGPVGLALALDLGRRGHKVVVLNRLPFIARGSKAICFSKRSLEIFDRLGIGDRLLEKGVIWEKGKVFWKDAPAPVYEFDLLPVKDQKFPAFINIQQYYVEEYLLDKIEKHENIEVRWRHELIDITPKADSVSVMVSTPDGAYEAETEYLLACDGCKSSVRTLMGLDFEGRVFEDNFLIADVKFNQLRPAERWFHFEPPYPGWSSLIHKQPDDVWRLDFQLGWDVDKKEAVKPENVELFVRGMLGPDVDFEFEWISIYTFQCRRMQRFVHDRILFAGDAAHVVSPFGARGCNGGLQDVDNLGWKLDRVLEGTSPPEFLETYNEEAIAVADENILNSARATDFMTPKTRAARMFRDAVLELSRDYAFARPFVNSGRLSTAVCYSASPLNDSQSDIFQAGPPPGSPCADSPVISSEGEDWLLRHIGNAFCILVFTDDDDECDALRDAVGVRVLQIARTGPLHVERLVDAKGLAWARYGADAGTVYLARPDQHVAGRWRSPDAGALRAALARAAGRSGGSACR